MTVSQRRFFTQRVLLALVAAAVLYCLAVSASSWTTPAQTITTNSKTRHMQFQLINSVMSLQGTKNRHYSV